MGREVRMVPPNWKHPKTERDAGQPQPMHKGTYEAAREKWLKELAEWDPAQHEGLDYWEYEGPPPDRPYYEPFSVAEATWFQLWETVSEGTPVSPPFATKEELAAYLAVNGDDWDERPGKGGWGIERARAFVEAGWAPSFAEVGGQLFESKDVPLLNEQLKKKI